MTLNYLHEMKAVIEAAIGKYLKYPFLNTKERHANIKENVQNIQPKVIIDCVVRRKSLILI